MYKLLQEIKYGKQKPLRNAICREIHKNMYVLDSLKQYSHFHAVRFSRILHFLNLKRLLIIIHPKLDLIHLTLNLTIQCRV